MSTPLPPQPLSPLDGRYRAAVTGLADYLSEAGLNRARVEVEVEWIIALTDRSLFGSAPLSDAERESLRGLYLDFGQTEIDWLAEKEAVTRHDVGADSPSSSLTFGITSRPKRSIESRACSCGRVPPEYLRSNRWIPSSRTVVAIFAATVSALPT